jgi:zinc transport system substrate-binding protein
MSGYIIRQPGCFRRRPGTGSRIKAYVLAAMMICGGLGLLSVPAWAATAGGGKLLVAATILPLGDFCRQIGGNLVQVQILIPPGASPHVFEPSPSEMARAFQARVFVYIGAGLEPWADRLLQARGSKNLVVVEAARGIPLLKMPGEVEEAHLTGNPHIWLDPVLAQEICRKIAAAYMQADTAHRAQYEANLKSYLAALAELNREIENHAKGWRQRDYVSFHPDLAYFARRYGLHNVGTIEAAPGREPTPRYLQNLVAAIHRFGIKVVFAEPQLNPRVAEVIAREAGAKVLRLDPLGGRPPYGSDYLKLMRHNLATLDQALQ